MQWMNSCAFKYLNQVSFTHSSGKISSKSVRYAWATDWLKSFFLGQNPANGAQFGCSALPGHESSFQENFKRTLDYAKALNCKKQEAALSMMKCLELILAFRSQDSHNGRQATEPGCTWSRRSVSEVRADKSFAASANGLLSGICASPAICWNRAGSSVSSSRSIITVFRATTWTATRKVPY